MLLQPKLSNTKRTFLKDNTKATLKAWLEDTDNEIQQRIHSRRKSLSANDNRLPYPMMCAHAPVCNLCHKEKTHASDLSVFKCNIDQTLVLCPEQVKNL